MKFQETLAFVTVPLGCFRCGTAYSWWRNFLILFKNKEQPHGSAMQPLMGAQEIFMYEVLRKLEAKHSQAPAEPSAKKSTQAWSSNHTFLLLRPLIKESNHLRLFIFPLSWAGY